MTSSHTKTDCIPRDLINKDDLLKMIHDLSGRDDTPMLGVKSVRALLFFNDEKSVLLERLNKQLPEGWYCQNVDTKSNDVFNVVVACGNQISSNSL